MIKWEKKRETMVDEVLSRDQHIFSYTNSTNYQGKLEWCLGIISSCSTSRFFIVLYFSGKSPIIITYIDIIFV